MPVLVLILAALCLLSPDVAHADGGGPLLLMINWMVFLYGSILIIAIEWFVYVRCAEVGKVRALWDSIIVNVISTALVGFGVPLLIAAISYLISAAALPGSVTDYALAIGTWIFEGTPFPKLTFAATVFWWITTFVLTVYVEKTVLYKLWEHRHFNAPVSATALSWKGNIATYAFLVMVFLAWLIWDNCGKTG